MQITVTELIANKQTNEKRKKQSKLVCFDEKNQPDEEQLIFARVHTENQM